MKKIVTILLSAATLVGVTGCESFLEEESYGSTTDLFNEENGLKKEYQVDAVHPNLEGFKVMESVFLPVFEQVTYNPDAVGSDGQLDDFDNEYWN